MDSIVAGPSTDLARFSTDAFQPQVLYLTDRQKVVLVALEDGQGIPPHAPDVDLTLVVTHGTGDVATDTTSRPVQAGDVVILPAGATRGVRARGGRLIAVLVVSPPPTVADHERRGSASDWAAPEPVERDVAIAIRDEHAELHVRLDDLAAVARDIDAIPDADLGDRLSAILTILKNELLPHAHVEDVALYPVIDRLLQATGGATATMSADHRAIAQRVAQLSAAGDNLARQDVRRLLHELHALLQVHFDKEEEVYLPLLTRLTADQHADLLDQLHHAQH